MSMTLTTADELAFYPELAELYTEWQQPLPQQLLANKTVLITGAGSGLGTATAKTCAAFGANIILLGKTRSKLEQVFDWIEANCHGSSVIVPCDLERLDMDTVAALSASIADNYGALHGIVHHASRLGPRTPLAHYPADEWQKVMATNVNAVFMLNQGLFELMDNSTGACVIHTSSTVGRVGRAYWGAYSASKFALEGLSQIFADETETAGNIRVYSVNPGGTRTPMRKAAYPLEDPATLPIPEAHMELFMSLLAQIADNAAAAGLRSFTTGQQLDARDWQQTIVSD